MNTTFSISEETIWKETEKAIMIRATGETVRMGNIQGFDMWIPKSLVKDGEIPMWFIQKVANEKFMKSISFVGSRTGVSGL